MTRPEIMSKTAAGPVLITGGAGFVGTNLADRFLQDGRQVHVYDNLSRAGVEQNLAWLQEQHGRNVTFTNADIRDRDALQKAVADASAVFHLAAQVAVTTSLVDPRHDVAVNLMGTFNLLEALRGLSAPPPLVFTSTNKVYGDLMGLELQEEDTRYAPMDAQVKADGVSERTRLDFHSPYGCSKGAADQYVLDYARSYGLQAVVFRMSCIYGPHQFGTEDQGWVAHFLIRALQNESITLYGDGRQVRDILFVHDLVDAFMRAHQNIHDLSGRAFNIGGGPNNTTSLLELIDLIGELKGERLQVRFEDWRVGDQRYYVSDVRAFGEATGWRPRVNVREGVAHLYDWLQEARGMKSSRPLIAKTA
jgi:CDP-paratose 2-epimerase